MAASSSILGHQSILNSLQEDLSSGNVAHVYLLSGQRHLGKFTVARAFAMQLLTQGADDAEQTADQVRRLLHPDVLVLDQLWIEEVCEDPAVIARSTNIPQQHRAKAKAKTDTISIDDIRALQERLHEIGIDKYRCCLIRSVERMQAEPVNALLKILEEPHPGMVFLLTTQSMGQLLPTLISRTRVLRFNRLPDEELAPLLEGTDDDERQFLLRVAQGAPGIVTQLRENPDQLRGERKIYASALAFWHSHSALERLQLLKPLQERGEAADQFLLHLFLSFREEVGAGNAEAARHLIALHRQLQTNASRPLLTEQFVFALKSEGA